MTSYTTAYLAANIILDTDKPLIFNVNLFDLIQKDYHPVRRGILLCVCSWTVHIGWHIWHKAIEDASCQGKQLVVGLQLLHLSTYGCQWCGFSVNIPMEDLQLSWAAPLPITKLVAMASEGELDSARWWVKNFQCNDGFSSFAV